MTAKYTGTGKPQTVVCVSGEFFRKAKIEEVLATLDMVEIGHIENFRLISSPNIFDPYAILHKTKQKKNWKNKPFWEK